MTKKSTHYEIIEFRNKLDSVSPSMCLAKWKQVTLHLHNGRTHSCHHPYPHPIPLDELKDNPSALHNTSYKKTQRNMMLDGAKPTECQYCWNVEGLDGYKSSTFFSDRITKSADDWAEPYFDEVINLPRGADINPSYVEVSFSNLCNFKCSYCSPVYSSRWKEEIEQHGQYNTSANYNNLEYFQQAGEMPIHHKDYNPYVEAFWEWWPDLVSSLSVFRITGGEPLLNDNTFKILDYLEVNPHPGLELAVNTNGCVPDKLFNSFIEKTRSLLKQNKIKALQIYTSVDGYGASAEYSRFGLDYAQWESNFEKLLNEIPQANVSIMCTTNIFSTSNFVKLLEFVLSMKNKYNNSKVTIDTSILRYPHHLNVGILPTSMHHSFDKALAFMKSNRGVYDEYSMNPGFYQFEIDTLTRLISYMKTGPSPEENIDIEVARSDFYIFVNEHDARRGTNFKETFPELSEFYKLCMDANNTVKVKYVR